MTGTGVGYSPSMKCRSLWHSPAKAVRSNTSRGPGLFTDTSSMVSGWFGACSTAAFIGGSSQLARCRLSLIRSVRGVHDVGQQLTRVVMAKRPQHSGIGWQLFLVCALRIHDT